jgi:ABC-type lipoprotein export system ATPase subunit
MLDRQIPEVFCWKARGLPVEQRRVAKVRGQKNGFIFQTFYLYFLFIGGR